MESRSLRPSFFNELSNLSTTEILGTGLITTFQHHIEGDISKELLIEITTGFKKNDCTIYIQDNTRVLGTIEGSLYYTKNQKIDFIAQTSRNNSNFPSKAGHVRGVVNGAIAHLVYSAIIDRWYSGDILSEDAKKMYSTHLAGDERLLVYPPSDETDNRYLIMRKS